MRPQRLLFLPGSGGGGGGISDAPSDGQKYGRKNAAWVVINDGYIDGEVQYHADLPVTVGDPTLGSVYIVREPSGLWLINRKPAGLWVRLANAGSLTDWTFAGTFPDVFSDANFVLYDDGDSTKELAFQLSGITTGTKRTLTAPDASGTIQLNRAALTALEVAESDVASATTCDIGAAASDNVRITGTTTITGLGTVAAGTRRYVRFAGALTLTHNATSLILPGGANITTAANDRMIAVSLGSGNWIVLVYQKADGTAVVASAGGARDIVFAASGTAVGAGSIWSNMPAAETFAFGTARNQIRADLTGYTQCRLVLTQSAAAFSGAKLIVRYKTSSLSETVGDYSDIGTSEVSIALSTSASATGSESSWINLAAGAKADVYIALIGSGGNGASDPAFGPIILQVK